jgi:hypothetical protein
VFIIELYVLSQKHLRRGEMIAHGVLQLPSQIKLLLGEIVDNLGLLCAKSTKITVDIHYAKTHHHVSPQSAFFLKGKISQKVKFICLLKIWRDIFENLGGLSWDFPHLSFFPSLSPHQNSRILVLGVKL